MQETPRDRLLREELADPEKLKGHIARLLGLLDRSVAGTGKRLVYVLAQHSRIGHLVLEPWALRAMYGHLYDEIVIVTGPAGDAANRAFFDYLRTGFAIVETDDIVLTTLGFVEGGAFSIGAYDVLLTAPQTLFYNFTKALANGMPHRFYELSDEDLRPARELRREYLGDPDMPYAVLHFRDANFAPEMSYHSFRFNAAEEYRPAVSHLLDRGYAVFRIGEPASPKLGIEHPHLVELLHREGYAREADFALVAEASFGLMSQSGPWAFFQALGRPVLLTNAFPEPFWVFEELEMALYKHVFHGDGRPVTYREMCRMDQDELFAKNLIEEAGYRSENVSPEEILAGVEEMLDILENGTPPDAGIQRAFHRITLEFDDSVSGAAALSDSSPRWQRRFSRRYLDARPGFLD